MSAFRTRAIFSSISDEGTFPNATPPFLARPLGSDFGCLDQSQCIIDVDPEVSNGVFNLGVAKQDLNRSKIAGRLVDQSCLCPTKGMGSILFRSQSNRRYPLVDQPRVLSGT